MVRIGWQVNMLLLVSKKCFLTSQGLEEAGMNCRALLIFIELRGFYIHVFIFVDYIYIQNVY